MRSSSSVAGQHPGDTSYRVRVRRPLPDPTAPGAVVAPVVVDLFAEVAECLAAGPHGHVGAVAAYSAATLHEPLFVGDALDVVVRVHEKGVDSWEVCFAAHLQSGSLLRAAAPAPSGPVATAVTTVVRQLVT